MNLERPQRGLPEEEKRSPEKRKLRDGLLALASLFAVLTGAPGREAQASQGMPEGRGDTTTEQAPKMLDAATIERCISQLPEQTTVEAGESAAKLTKILLDIVTDTKTLPHLSDEDRARFKQRFEDMQKPQVVSSK
ncbi:MAG: hypothetical protein A2319_05025 [Candidatus Kerfeldbacteria bacterium RIFOXYB2_FULL_38_14]|uniref:Uncharacterized protein n=1 Tax=Candidatus Kerfeldbacteria bacterium RIFOXYB2_FULL_38_14 TaxID=1798547 RepID=A0A1G2BF36_9BACT|nr:MAG: hypothetical protein A2319_05025 [Candidatus Kerfeldbacteria bacterium RIFOXYB2_FULL_38_14]